LDVKVKIKSEFVVFNVVKVKRKLKGKSLENLLQKLAQERWIVYLLFERMAVIALNTDKA
jgi:GTP cyclohydrolase II